jgi:long-chain fatty acid transport protein
MTKRFTVRRIFLLMSAAGLLTLSQTSMATGYQLWEQDAASLGNYHAGRAAIAEDASTAFYNPAGLVRIHNQQIIIGLIPVLTNMTFRGTVNNTTLVGTTPISSGNRFATANGGGIGILPDFHYAAPITDKLVFGLSAVTPFGLRTFYGYDSYTRYSATDTSLKLIDISPSLGYAVTDKLSVGAGLDFEHARARFNLMATIPNPFVNFDTYINNRGTSNAYGYHAGALYQFTPATRLGISYHSKVIHHLQGVSDFVGRLANGLAGGTQTSDYLRANLPLPATSTVSLFHNINPLWDVMGSVSYTQWNILKQLVLRAGAGIQNLRPNNSIVVVIPENYRNTWNYSVGANYHASEQWTFRTGLGYDQSPTNNTDRNLQLPDSDRIAVALGGHYQATKSFGVDMGWTHLFAMNTRVNNTQAVGGQTTQVIGSIQASADVFGVQLKWDLV